MINRFIKPLYKYCVLLVCLCFFATISFGQIPVIQNPSTSSYVAGVAYSFPITATNSPTSYSATSLPTGLSVNTTTGTISGTPTVSGIFTGTLNATNSSGTGSESVNYTINPVITSVNSASSIIGNAFTFNITATNSLTSYTYSATGLPASLSINSSTGVISGIPTVPNTYSITVIATNAAGTAIQSLALTILPCPTATISSPSQCLLSGLNTTLTASPTPCNGCSYTWAISSGTGSLTNQTSNTIRYNSIGQAATITATYTDGTCATSSTFIVSVNPPVPTFSSPSCVNSSNTGYPITITNPQAGSTYSVQFINGVYPNELNFLTSSTGLIANGLGIITVPINTSVLNASTGGQGEYNISSNNGTCSSWNIMYNASVIPLTPVTITSANACFSSIANTLTASPALCSGCTYTWSVSPSGAGTFSNQAGNTISYKANYSGVVTATYTAGSCSISGTLNANTSVSIMGPAVLCFDPNNGNSAGDIIGGPYSISGALPATTVNWSTSQSSISESNYNTPTPYSILSSIQPNCSPCISTYMQTISFAPPVENGIIQLNASVNGCAITPIPLYVGVPTPVLIKPIPTGTTPSPSNPVIYTWTALAPPYITGYRWYIDNQFYTTTTPTKTLTFTAPIDISITFCQAINACGYYSPQDWNRPELVQPDSIAKNELANYIISPNPANNVIKITTNGDLTIDAIIIYNISGAREKYTRYSQVQQATINIADLANGTYFVEILSGKSVQTQKIVVQH